MIAKTLSRLGIEVWKDIPEFEGLYQASNLGNIRSLNYKKTGKSNVLKTPVNSRGRKICTLYFNGKKNSFYTYVLVAYSFLNHKPKTSKLVIDHIDNNKENDKLFNLQIITVRENTSKDRKGISKHIGVTWHKATNKWMAQIQINGNKKYLGVFTDEKEAAQAYQNELNKIKL